MTKISSKITKFPQLFCPQKIQKVPQIIQKWLHGFYPQIYKKALRGSFVKFGIFVLSEDFFALLEAFLYTFGGLF
jgi:hypothetical protein